MTHSFHADIDQGFGSNLDVGALVDRMMEEVNDTRASQLPTRSATSPDNHRTAIDFFDGITLPCKVDSQHIDVSLESVVAISDEAAADSETDANAKAKEVFAEQLFEGFGGLMTGAVELPHERVENYKAEDSHNRVAAMVKEVLVFGNRQAFTDLKLEAGRPDWAGASSIAPTAFHRLSVVNAIKTYEEALESGDKQKQSLALTEIAKLRHLRLGRPAEFGQVHDAIDAYLEKHMEGASKDISPAVMRVHDRRARQELTSSYRTAATALTDFLSTNSPGQRLNAFERFQQASGRNPSGTFLELGARMGDYLNVLNISEVLSNPNPDSEMLVRSLTQLEKLSPVIAEEFLTSVLKGLQNDSKTNDKFAGVQKLSCEELVKLLTSEGSSELLLPHLKAAISGKEFQKTLTEHHSLASSNLSPADLLRVGLKGPSPAENAFNDRLQEVKDEIKKANKEYQALERTFLHRNATAAERQDSLSQLSDKLRDSQPVVGDSMLIGNTDRLETIDQVLRIREAKTPADAVTALQSLKQMADSGNPHATKALGQLFPGAEQTVETTLKGLQSSDKVATETLAELLGKTSFVDEELDKLRIANLTRHLHSHKPPGETDLDELERSLADESRNGNKFVGEWANWIPAARLVSKLSASFDQKQRVKLVEDLASLARGGNGQADKMLIGVLTNNVEQNSLQIWKDRVRNEDGPPTLIANPAAIDTWRRELNETALRGLDHDRGDKPVALDGNQTLVLSLVLGGVDTNQQSRIQRLLANSFKGANGDDALSGVFEALRSNAPGGNEIARVLLQGANRQDFPRMFEQAARWAENGDSAGITVLAGILSGKQNNPNLTRTARESILKCASDPAKQKMVIECLLQTYEKDVRSARLQTAGLGGTADFTIVEVLGDVLGKANKEVIPQELSQRVKEIFRQDLKWFNTYTSNGAETLEPEQERRIDHLIRGFVSLSGEFTAASGPDKGDLALIENFVRPALAEALRDKNWNLPEEIRPQFVRTIMKNLQGRTLPALDCLGSMAKILKPQDLQELAKIMSRIERRDDPGIRGAYGQTLLRIIGSKDASPELVSVALNSLEHSQWYQEHDEHVRKALTDYVSGRMPSLEQLDKVIAIIGDCGIEPPVALVVSRMGMPLNQETITKVEAAQKNLGGDRSAFLKVLERTAQVNALPASINTFGRVNLETLLSRMAEAPLVADTKYGFLATDAVDTHLKQVEDKILDRLLEKANAQRKAEGHPQIDRPTLVSSLRTPDGGGVTSGGDAQKDYDKSLDQLQKVTRDGHQTSYWWLMAGGVGYLVKRFAPGGTADQFQDRQRDALNDWRSAQETLAKSMMENNILTDCLKELDSMKVASSYVKALGDGEVRDSDMHALDLLRRCGAEGLHKQFPFIYKGIFGDDLDPKLLGRTVALEAKSGEIWQRLKRMHVTETDAPPRFRTTGDALNYLVRADLCRSQGPSSDSLYLQRKDVHDAAVSEAFRHVDQDERMAAALSTYGKLAGLMGTTQMLFHEGMAGERGSHYTNFARRMADQMQETLEELRREAPAIRQLIKELEQAREKAVDVDAKEGLNARIKILDDILTGFVPNSQGQTNSRKYNELQEMCRVMRSTDFDPNTFGTWLRDNAVSLALVTTALAGIATMPFSGGASGVLATIAISALTATTCYVASEAWKFGMHKWGGAAYGSDFVDCVLELAGVKTRDTNTLKYEGGKFVVPKQMDEVFADALKEIGKETLLFVGAAGFGKLVGETLKHCSNPAAKMAGTEMIKDVNKLAKALDVAAAKNPLAVRWAKDFMREWVDQIPWAVVAGTTEAILHDSINALDPEGKMGQDREVLEHMAHIAAVGFTVFSHRVAGHVMRPHVLAGGKVEIPYNRADFLFELRKHYTAIGKPVPEILIGEDGTASIKAGKKTLSLVFEDPKAVALQLNRLGIKPDPPVPGEPIAPAEATPGEGQKLRSGEPQKTLVEQLEPETLTRLREMVDKGEISHNDFILLQRAYRLGLLKPAPGESITKFLKERILDTESSIRSAFLEDLSFDLRFLERQLAVQGRAVESGPESPAQPAPEAAGAVTGPAAGGELPGGLVPLTPEAYKAPNSSTPVVYRTAEGPRSGYVVTDSSGKSVFVPEPGTTPAVAGEASWSKVPEGYVKVRTNADGTLYYDPASKKLYSVRTDGGALKACEIRSNVSDIPDSELHWPITHAVVRERRALQVGNVRVSSARNGRSLTVGDSPDCDVVAGQAHRNGSRSAVVWGSEEGFFVQKLPGGERVVIRHSDGSADTVLSSGSTHRLRAGDTLVVGEKSVSCTPTTEPAFLKRPLSQTAGETQRGAKIDFAEKVEVTESLKDGGVYEDTYLTNSKVPRRIVDPNHPVIQKVLRDAQELLAQRGKMTPDEEIMVCARLIHELSTPYDTAVDPLSGTNSRTKNDARLNIRAENLDTDIARPDGSKIIHLGDLVTFKRMVCLDQAMLLKVLLDSRGYKCKVVTGKYGSGGHAWCEVEIGGKQYIYDPRNINSQRQGMPAERATAYEPYKSPSERGKKQTLSGQDATRDAIDELKNGSDFEAAAIAASLPEGQITPELRSAVRDRISRELSRRESDAKAGDLVDLARRFFGENDPLMDSIKQRILRDLQSSPELPELIQLAKSLKIKGLEEAVKTRILNELRSERSTFTAEQLFEIATDLKLLDGVKSALYPKLADEIVSGSDNTAKVRRILEKELHKDPTFLDNLADAVARRIATGDPRIILEITNLFQGVPELVKLTKMDGRLEVDKDVAQTLSKLEEAVKGTDLDAQIAQALKDPTLAGDNARLNDLYNRLVDSKNERIRDFVGRHAKAAVMDALVERSKVARFNEIMRDPELNRILAKRPLKMDEALEKLKKLLTSAKFPADKEGNIVGHTNDSLITKLRQRSRSQAIRRSVFDQVETLLKGKESPTKEALVTWKSLAESVEEFRALNAIKYFENTETRFPREFVEGIKLDDKDLADLAEIVEQRETDRSKMSLEDFQAFLGRFDCRGKQKDGSSHADIVTQNGERAVSYIIKGQRKNASYATEQGRRVKEVYQEEFLEGMEWLILNGKRR